MDKGGPVKLNGLREEIFRVLSKHPKGKTIYELAKLLQINRQTVSKYIFALTEMGLVEQIEVGRAKLCILKKREKK